MRLHSDTLTRADIQGVLHLMAKRRHDLGLESLTNGTWLDTCDERGSRSRERGFTCILVHDGTLSRRRRNPGTSQDRSVQSEWYAAPYDHWGWWLSALYELDHDLVANGYESRGHFHAVTGHRFYLDEVTEWTEPAAHLRMPTLVAGTRRPAFA